MVRAAHSLFPASPRRVVVHSVTKYPQPYQQVDDLPLHPWESGTIQDAITVKQGLSFGAVWTVYHVARRLGIDKALGTTRAGKLALWQVIARGIAQGSRLSAVRLAMAHAACDVLG